MIGKDGHNYPDRRGANNPKWSGGRQKTGNGYIQVVDYAHPKADSRGRILEHVYVAERVLGSPLPPKAVVHHVDGNSENNDPANLVICEDQGYHVLLHRRERALKACGHADYLRCRHCRHWDSPENLKVFERKKEGIDAYHKSCHAQAEHIRLALKGVN